MNFLNHYCFKQLFSGGIEPTTSAYEIRHSETGIPLLKLLISLKFKNKLQIFGFP